MLMIFQKNLEYLNKIITGNNTEKIFKKLTLINTDNLYYYLKK